MYRRAELPPKPLQRTWLERERLTGAVDASEDNERLRPHLDRRGSHALSMRSRWHHRQCIRPRPVGVDDMLTGKFPAPGTCPHCGDGSGVALDKSQV
jgi:hypothetical protein